MCGEISSNNNVFSVKKKKGVDINLSFFRNGCVVCAIKLGFESKRIKKLGQIKYSKINYFSFILELLLCWHCTK